MSKLREGVNDLSTIAPRIAREAEGWDPSKVSANSNTLLSWTGLVCGHTWDRMSPKSRVQQNQGCPYCRGYRVLAGFNDLKSQFPTIALEADGWDPATVTKGSRKKLNWICPKGHRWSMQVKDRSGSKKCGCPFCAGIRCWPGYNDLESIYPELAKEADEWDPSLVTAHSPKKLRWKCAYGHSFLQSPKHRTQSLYPQGCPYCGNRKLLKGFNDLATRHPETAAEADGWDPASILYGSKAKCPFICIKCGRRWSPTIQARTAQKQGCPSCAETGFNPGKPGWMYLMSRPGEQQFGISNVIEQRLQVHRRDGWVDLEIIGPFPGDLVFETEQKLIQWLKKSIGTIPGKRENWSTTVLEIVSLKDLFLISGVNSPE
jgi:hypothetical protein